MKNGINENKKKRVIIFTFVCLIIIIAVGFILYKKFEINERFFKNKKVVSETASESTTGFLDDTLEETDEYDEGVEITKEDLEKYDLYEDAEQYYEENSTIISKINANDSDVVYSEKDVTEKLTEIGFDQYDITYSYSMDGKFYTEDKVVTDSDTKHPLYETYYNNTSDELWLVMIVNNEIVAYPISYNLASEASALIVFSEKDSVISYDNITNQFFETIPNSTEMIIVEAETINKELLDELTKEEIDKYVE